MFAHSIHLYMFLMLLYLTKKLFGLYGVSQFNRFSKALEVSLLFTCGLLVASFFKELSITFVVSQAQ